MTASFIEVDLSVLSGNLAALRAVLRRDTDLIFVVKSDAYGHGLIPVAGWAWEAGVRRFAVISLDRALQLRRALPEADVLLLGSAEAADAPLLIAERIVPVLHDMGQASGLAAAARRRGRVLEGHLKFDTGMGRMGIRWTEGAGALERIAGMKGLHVSGVMSHLARAGDGDLEDAARQAARFLALCTRAANVLGRPVFRHLSSSAAFLHRPEWDLDAVRPGLFLYGYGDFPRRPRARSRPALQWKASIVQVRRVPARSPIGYGGTYRTRRATDIGIVNVGYADGYSRALGNGGEILVRGRRRRVAGRVSMNWTALDLGPRSGVQRGDEAVLIGRQGGAEIWADELAGLCGTIPYEMLTGLGSHLPRRYIGGRD